MVIVGKKIQQNDPIELTVWGRKDAGCVKAVGYTRTVEDLKTKIRLSKTIPWVNSNWESPTDSEFTLLQLDLDLVTIDNSNNRESYTVPIH